jgi:hypothetical protein
MNNFKCFCVTRSKIINFNDYMSCRKCINAENILMCKTLENVGPLSATGDDVMETRMKKLIITYRKNKLKRILK